MKEAHKDEIKSLHEEIFILKKNHDDVLAQSIKTKMKMIEQIEMISRKSSKGGKSRKSKMSHTSFPINKSIASGSESENINYGFRHSVPANVANFKEAIIQPGSPLKKEQ